MNKKTKIGIITTIIIILLWIITFFYINYTNKNSNNKSNKTLNLFKNDWKENENTKNNVNKQDKISELRSRLALKWLILKWDENLANWEYISALIKYLQINKEIPNDKSIIQKIWDTYYELKKYDKAYTYYLQLKWNNIYDRNKTAKTLLFSRNASTDNVEDVKKELLNLWLSKEELFYYTTSLVCKVNFSECRKEFHNYFDLVKRNQTENAWSGTTNQVKKFTDLENIGKALENYDNFQVEDLDYKWALLAWAFYENWLYTIAIKTSEEILKTKKDYKPLIKIIAKSYYELWLYIDAKVYLIKYKEIDPNDNEITFFLWVVYEKLHEYILSTVHFDKAIKNWYKDTVDAYKRIIYNYYEMDNLDKMIETINEMVSKNKEKLSAEDFNLSIYYNIVKEDTKKAKEYTSYAIKKFPESEVFNWYMWWILMQEENKKPLPKYIEALSWSWSEEKIKYELEKKYRMAESYIDKWLKQKPDSPMINLVKWKLEIFKRNYKEAYAYLSKTVKLDENWEFWELARNELNNIQVNK